MDKLALNAAEDFCAPGYPRDCESLLICELDGPAAEVDHLIGEVEAMARQHGASFLKVSESEEERLGFWAGRKNAFSGCWPHQARTISAWMAPFRALNWLTSSSA